MTAAPAMGATNQNQEAAMADLSTPSFGGHTFPRFMGPVYFEGDDGGGAGGAGDGAGEAGDGQEAGDKAGAGDAGGQKAADADDLGDRGKKALDEERKARRDAEKERNDLRKKLEKLETDTLSGQEKAVKEAEDRGRKTAEQSSARRVAAAELKAALTGIVPNPTAIVEDLNLDRYLTEDGELDDEKVKQLKANYADLAKPGKPGGDADGGNRGGGKPKQLSRSDLKSMSPDAIVEAQAKGQLADLLAGTT